MRSANEGDTETGPFDFLRRVNEGENERASHWNNREAKSR